ncbi:MAG: hypothetical protein AMJ81_13695 [Phycisphaerae bacterium SM23_33]|nr:MAG: hypothetical protein AMJ81_13695 [Phycisphaerae bacterium SM23_33]
MRVVLTCVAWLIVAQPVLRAEQVIALDHSCPIRCYYRFATDQISPAALKAQGEQLLGKAQYERLRRATQKSAAISGNDAFAVFRPSPLVLHEARRVGTIAALRKEKQLGASAAGDWHGLVFRRMFFDPYTAPPPPADWAAPGFDDRDWMLGHGPFQLDMANDLPPQATKGNMRTVHVNVLQYIGSGIHAACYRARFVVADPTKAGDLTFTATYRGGLRVLVNGREVARGHLPKGDLSAEAPAQDYPLEAYANAALRDRTLGPVTIPAGMLRQGGNVLALEVRASLLHPTVLKKDPSRSWNALHDREGLWRHGFLGKFKLTSPDGSVASGKARPPGLCAWVEDMHRRVRSDDLGQAGEARGVLRLVGPRNGLCSAQLVLGTDKDIAAIEATVTELRSVTGDGAIPTSAVSVFHMMPYPEEGLSEKLGDERGLAGSFPTQAQLQQHTRMPDARQRYVFDHITSQPQPLPAGRSRPLWISLRIPADTPAGLYRGTLRCKAEGLAEMQVPVEAEVVGWRLPDPKDFQTYVGLEENPYGVAQQYGVAAWSDQHFKLLEGSLHQIARAGGTWLNVPVVRGTEFGNRDDSMIRWLRKRDGSFAYDFRVLDRYLELAVKHLGKPRMINFVVMPGLDGPNFQAAGEIMVTDEATGKTAPVPACGPGVSLAEKKRIWLPLATALHRHLQAKGLDKAMHWGYPLDSELDHELVVLLGDHLPAVRWLGGPHQLGGYREPKYYGVLGTVRYFDNFAGFRMSMGWKAPQTHLTIPRIDSSVQSLITASHPFAFRTLVNHSLALGRAGFTRVGADAWASSHYAGMRIPTWIVGMPVLFTLWPGPEGAESSARHEALIEGIQEAEARIFIEKALDSGRLPSEWRRRVTDVLQSHYLETTFFQNKLCIHELERYHYRWQERSRKLYQAAAAVSEAMRPDR